MVSQVTCVSPLLLQPDSHAVLLIGRQYLQLVNARSHDAAGVVAAAVLLARAAKLFDVPALLLTGLVKREGMIPEVQAVFPDQVPIDRTNLDAFEDARIVDWVEKTARRKLVMGRL